MLRQLSCLGDKNTSSTTYAPSFPETATKSWYWIFLTYSVRNVCKNVSPWPIDLIARFCRSDSAWLHCDDGFHSLPAITTQLSSQSLSSHTFCSSPEISSTTINPCNCWHGKFEHLSTHTFCSWDHKFCAKRELLYSEKNSKCTESPSTLSTKISVVWTIYLCWSNHLDFLLMKTDIGGFSKYQNTTKDTDRYKGYFYSNSVSEVNMKKTKRSF